MCPIAKSIVFSLLVLTACRDKNTDCHDNGTCPPEYYRFELGELKSYLWAKPGSYWIYKNTKTGDLDTHTCTGFYFDSAVSKGTYDHSRHITIKYDVLQRSIHSSFNNWTFYDKAGGYEANATPLSNSASFNLEKSYSEGPGWIIALFYPFTLNKSGSNGASRITCIGMDSTLTIQGKTYYNVAKFDIDRDAIDEKNCPNIPVTTYYWAKDIGLIKKTVNNCNFSWELIDYAIIQ